MKNSNTGTSFKYGLALAALGVVFGDIGTSPLYALRECFIGKHAIFISSQNILGSVSLIFWFLLIIVALKYSVFVMKADNKGEGGILALMALVHRLGSPRLKQARIISLLGITGAALLFSDGVLTPAVSVLSAVEGLNVATPLFSKFIVPISIVILACLFAIQSHGTARIGALFSPIVSIWFITIAILGIVSIVKFPHILYAVNPVYAVSIVMHSGIRSLALLGTAFLAVTGAEVLYADMGHFGKKPIRLAWFAIVFPALILNYFGQGAHLLHGAHTAENLFYQIAPPWFVLPLVVIATLATIIASQAVISGAFSLFRQAVQLGFWPRMKIVHTSTENIGQVFIPFVNLALFTVTVLLILGFKQSGNLASAYGIAVSATMLITTFLILALSRQLWNAPLYISIPFGVLFILLDTSLFAANLSKVVNGGWIVVVIAFSIIILMTTWVTGRIILQQKFYSAALPIESFVRDIDKSAIARINKPAVFLSSSMSITPRSILHNYKHNGIIHNQTLIVSVVTDETPFIPESVRVQIKDYGSGFYGVVLRYGFMESPDVPKEIVRLDIPDLPNDKMQFSYFLGKESLIVSPDKSMQPWRKQIFLFMARNAESASNFFKLPFNRVVELGVQIEF